MEKYMALQCLAEVCTIVNGLGRKDLKPKAGETILPVTMKEVITIQTIVVMEPRKRPKIRQVEDLSLKVMQQIVEGYIQVVDMGDNILLVCNEEGKLQNKLGNFPLGDDIIVGTVLFCCGFGEEMIGLTSDQTETILNWFNTRS